MFRVQGHFRRASHSFFFPTEPGLGIATPRGLFILSDDLPAPFAWLSRGPPCGAEAFFSAGVPSRILCSRFSE